jgi:phosphoglycerate dehydrogenase-like enzyme
VSERPKVVVVATRPRDVQPLLGRDEIAAMKSGAYLVNVGRGGIVDEDALLEALRQGRLAGAALDVFRKEPLPPESPLWQAPNLFVSPHLAGDAYGWQECVLDLFADNLRRYIHGTELRNVVDKQRGY